MLPKLSPFEEKVWGYLKDKKNPASTKQIAKYFIRSESHVSNALTELINLGLVERLRVGNLHLYLAKNNES